MRVKTTVGALALGVMLMLPSRTFASLIGDDIFGVLNFGGFGATNFWDPANGFVPAGSNPAQPDAIVADPDGGFVEFQYADFANGLYGDVDAFTIDIHEFPIIPSGLNSWNILIGGLDQLGPLTAYNVLFDSFDAGSLSILLGTDSVLFSFIGGEQIPEGRRITIELVGTTVVPEPGTIFLLGMGVLGLALLRKRQ